MRLLASLLCIALRLAAQSKSPLRFEISWEKPMDGHVVLVLSSNPQGEPRNQVNEGLNTQQMFGADADGARTVSIDGATLGYPRESLDRVPAGEYTVQAVLNVYETFHRADGRTLKLPMDQGEGQHWNRKPGNLYRSFDDPVHRRVDAVCIAPASKQLLHPLHDQSRRCIRQHAFEAGSHLNPDPPLVRGPQKQHAVVHRGLSHAPRVKEPARIVVHQHPVQRRHNRHRDLVPRDALIRAYLRFQRLHG